ncbi:hypothetical protein J7K50_06595 [bacterium]|nr:hypothetical protein [bacterium]
MVEAMTTSNLRVIFTCGGKLTKSLEGRSPEDAKVLIEIEGRSLLHSAIEACTGLAESISKEFSAGIAAAVAVGPRAVGREVRRVIDACDPPFPIHFAGDGATVLDNIGIGASELDHYGTGDLLIVSPDLPFITADALSDFLEKIPDDAGLAMPVVTREAFNARFPGAPNRFNRLVEGFFTLGSIAFLKEDVLRKNLILFQDAHNARKNPAKLAGMLGPGVILKYIFGRLSIHDIEDRVGLISDTIVHAVVGCDPALAYDIDNEKNLDYAEKMLAQ